MATVMKKKNKQHCWWIRNYHVEPNKIVYIR